MRAVPYTKALPTSYEHCLIDITLKRPKPFGLHLVDERLVGHKPAALSPAEAAALPLTTFTAYELMFERIGLRRLPETDGRVLLVVGAAGGVGSIAIQLARRLTDLAVIATASREDSRAWCLEMGAHHVIDHLQPLTPQIRRSACGPQRSFSASTPVPITCRKSPN